MTDFFHYMEQNFIPSRITSRNNYISCTNTCFRHNSGQNNDIRNYINWISLQLWNIFETILHVFGLSPTVFNPIIAVFMSCISPLLSVVSMVYPRPSNHVPSGSTSYHVLRQEELEEETPSEA